MLRNDISTSQDFLIDTINYINDYFKSPSGTVITIDLDGDFDLDLVYCDNNRKIRFIENNLSFPTGFKSANIAVENLNVFPNPSSSIAIIKSTNKSSLGRIELIDISGRVIKYYRTQASELEINLIDLQSGLYFFRIGQSNSLLKVIKN
jgi:hypothetical protein